MTDITPMFEDRDIIKLYEDKKRRKQINRTIIWNLVAVVILLILGYLKIMFTENTTGTVDLLIK